MKNEKHFTLRIEDDLLKKFRYVCSYNGRSANAQILYLIRNHSAKFEKEYGEINIKNKT